MDKHPVVNGNITAFSCGDTHIGSVNNYYSAVAMTEDERNKLISPIVSLIKNKELAEEAKLIQIYSKKVHGDSFLLKLDDKALIDVHQYYLLVKEILDANTNAYQELKAKKDLYKLENKALLEKKEWYRVVSETLASKRCVFCKIFSK